MSHSPYYEFIPVPAGKVLRAEGTNPSDLVKGQIGLFDMVNSAKTVSSLNGFSTFKNSLVLGVGTEDIVETRSQGNNVIRSTNFAVKDIQAIRAHAPKKDVFDVDEVVLGWNGMEDAENCTPLNFKKGGTYQFALELSGSQLGMYSGVKEETFTVNHYVEGCSSIDAACEDCDPCESVNQVEETIKVIEAFKEQVTRGGVKITELVDISLVKGMCTNYAEQELVPYVFYNLDRTDEGSQADLAEVRSQYAGMRVERTSRKGLVSTYTIMLAEDETAPVAFEEPLSDVAKFCNDCPDNYTEVEGGYIYTVRMDDAKADESVTVETLPNAVVGTGVKLTPQNEAEAIYMVATTAKLTQEEIIAFAETNVSATVSFVGESQAMCENGATAETIDWVAGETCNAIEASFYLTLPDVKCGSETSDRLEELQEAYPDMTIAIAEEETEGGTVTSMTDINCSTKYIGTKISNILCDECSDIFKDYYVADYPEDFDGHSWTDVEAADTVESCSTGIKFKGKRFEILPDQCAIDHVGAIQTSTKVRVDGGYATDYILGQTPAYKEPFHKYWISRAEPVQGMGFQMLRKEAEGHFRRTGRKYPFGDIVRKAYEGFEYLLEPTKQYIVYDVQIHNEVFAQAPSNTVAKSIVYQFPVEIGKQAEFEEFLNELAAAAGIEGVHAFGQPNL